MATTSRIGLVGAVIVAIVLGALAATHAQDAPSLTELERVKLELLQVRTAYAQVVAQFDGCKAEVGSVYQQLGQLRASAATTELTAQERKLKADVEAGHPGYMWDPKTAAFTKKPDAK